MSKLYPLEAALFLIVRVMEFFPPSSFQLGKTHPLKQTQLMSRGEQKEIIQEGEYKRNSTVSYIFCSANICIIQEDNLSLSLLHKHTVIPDMLHYFLSRTRIHILCRERINILAFIVTGCGVTCL